MRDIFDFSKSVLIDVTSLWLLVGNVSQDSKPARRRAVAGVSSPHATPCPPAIGLTKRPQIARASRADRRVPGRCRLRPASSPLCQCDDVSWFGSHQFFAELFTK